MSRTRSIYSVFVVCLVFTPLGGCQKDGGGDGSKTPKSSNTSAGVANPVSQTATPPPRASATVASEGAVLKLEGLTMEIPSGWGRPTVKTGQFSNKTVIALPKAGADENDGSVEITHFPGMKGMDERNIQRWIASVTQSDGSPHTRETARVSIAEVGPVRITTVDLSGTVRKSMRAGGGEMPDHRMIAAIVDHPRGPHFVKAVGGSSTMTKWAQSMKLFLDSAIVSTD